MENPLECKECPVITIMTDSYNKLYSLHKLALQAIIVIAFGKELVIIVEKIFLK